MGACVGYLERTGESTGRSVRAAVSNGATISSAHNKHVIIMKVWQSIGINLVISHKELKQL